MANGLVKKVLRRAGSYEEVQVGDRGETGMAGSFTRRQRSFVF